MANDELNLVEASIDDLKSALTSGAITSVELVQKYLQRVMAYDQGPPLLNSITKINPKAQIEAEASDGRRAAGLQPRPLEGIPYTIKDSFKYCGMSVACGSPAFSDLMPNEDAFVVKKLRDAGAVLLGKTNMPAMADGGTQRGLYGRAESPYNLDYLTAAFASGSSNGAATSTAASFAAFGLGSETVSSGRSPASNNGLVAYTPSRAVISTRGLWPLYPLCDVVVPYTRTVGDMLLILEVLTAEDDVVEGDFWREQAFIKLAYANPFRSGLCTGLKDPASLRGKRIAVPKMYIGLQDSSAKPVTTRSSVIDLWQRARNDLEGLGATILETDFPVVANYEDDSVSGQPNNVIGIPINWNALERCEIISYSWNQFLKLNGDLKYKRLGDVDPQILYPKPRGYIPDKFAEAKNAMSYPAIVDHVRDSEADRRTVYDVVGMGQALKALEDQRVRDFENWMDQSNIDLVVFPANGDVRRTDCETNEESACHALENGVKYSNGNRVLRHLGIPTVSVTMGLMEDTRMPVNLTFAGKAASDLDLLRYAYSFEHRSKRRVAPPLTPPLRSDILLSG